MRLRRRLAALTAILVILQSGSGLAWWGVGRAVLAAPAEGSLVRIASHPAVYYVGRDGRRYVFPNEATYFSWYHNFDGVQVIDDVAMAAMAVGHVITVRPNVRFVRFESQPRVYAVEPGGVLRWVPDEDTFRRLGFRFDQVVTVPDVLWSSYTVGATLSRAPSGAVVRVGEGGSLYYVRHGQRRLATEESLRQNRYFPNHIRVVAADALDGLAEGAPLQSFEAAVAGRPDDVADGGTPPPQIPPQTPTTTPPQLRPAAPTGFTATGGSQQVQLNWVRSTSTAVIGYVLSRSLSFITPQNLPAAPIVATLPATASNYSNTGLGLSTLYHYALRALATGNVFSDPVTASATTLPPNAPQPPLPPTGFTATGGSQQVQLSWQLSATPGVTNYVLYRSSTTITDVGSPTVAVVATTTGSATSYADSGLAVGATYHYAVRARGSNGLYSAHVVASAATLGGGEVPPGAPGSLAATVSQQDVLLTWAAPGGTPVASYQVYRSASPIVDVTSPGVTAVATVAAPAAGYLDAGLSASTAYHYAVRAASGANVTGPLANVSATTGVADQNAPRSLASFPGSSTVHLTWAAPTNAGYVRWYQVYRSTSPITASNPGTLISTGNSTTWTTDGASPSLLDLLLSPNTTYYYALKSMNASGQVSAATIGGPVTTLAAPAPVSLGGHPRVSYSGQDISGIRQRMQPSGPVNENLWQTANAQWSGGGYSRIDNLRGSLVDYSGLTPGSWTHSITAATPPQQILDSFKQWGNVVTRGSLLALLTDDQLARQRATAGLLAVAGLYTDIASAWVPDGSYPDGQPRQEVLKSMMSTVATGYDQLYPWLTVAQRQQVASVARPLLEKYRQFWIPDGLWVLGETHTHEDNAIYLRSLMAFHGDADPLPADRQGLDAASAAKLAEYHTYLQWLAQFMQDGSGGASPYWGYYAYGEISRMLAAVETVTVATGQNLYAQYPWLQSIVRFQAGTWLPNDHDLYSGDGGYGIHYNIVPMLRLAQRYGNGVAAWLVSRFRTHAGVNQNAYKEWGLLYDPTLPTQTPAQVGYELDWFSSRAGLATVRSGWDDGAVVGSLMNPPTMRLQKLHQDAGHFSIYYRGPQAVKSGAYDVGNGSPHYVQYYRKTISANTITIFDPAETFCGSRYHPAELPCTENPSWNDGGQNYRRQAVTPSDILAADRQLGTTALDSQPSYSYVRADLTPAYRRYADASYSTFVSKASQVVRELVYLRPKTFVILDRVTATDASFTKRWLLHTEAEPTVSGAVLSSPVPGHITVHDGDTVTVAPSGQGRLFAKLLLPASRQVRKVGGAGYEFYVDGYGNYPALICDPPNQAVCDGRGKWRLEVSPTVPSAADLFLNVLHVDDAGVASMPATQLLATTATGTAVQVGSTAVAFSGDGQAQLDGSYVASGATEHVFANLVPGATYLLTVQDAGDGSTVTTIAFTATAGGTGSVSGTPAGSYRFVYSRQ